jgi:hypothetical protein
LIVSVALVTLTETADLDADLLENKDLDDMICSFLYLDNRSNNYFANEAAM